MEHLVRMAQAVLLELMVQAALAELLVAQERMAQAERMVQAELLELMVLVVQQVVQVQVDKREVMVH